MEDWTVYISEKRPILDCHLTCQRQQREFLKCLIDDTSSFDVPYIRQFLNSLDDFDFEIGIGVENLFPFVYCIKHGNLVYLIEIINFMLRDASYLRYHFACFVEMMMEAYINDKSTAYSAELQLYRADVSVSIERGTNELIS